MRGTGLAFHGDPGGSARTLVAEWQVMNGSSMEGGAGRGRPGDGTAAGTPPELLTGLLQGISDPVYVKDVAGRYLYVNDSCAEVFGIAPAEALGRTDADLLPEPEVRRVRAVDEAVMSERASRTLEEELTTQGRSHVLESIRFPWTSVEGEVLGVIGISRDVTERHAADVALRDSERRFRLLADTAPVLIWSANEEGLCDFFNRGWLQFTGVSASRQMGEGWLDLVHPDDRDAVREIYRDSFREQRAFRAEYRLQCGDGTYHWVQDAGAPRFTDQNEFVGFVGSATDIHDAVLQQHAVAQSARELEELTTELELTVSELRARTTEAESARERAELTEQQARFLDDASRVLQESLDPHETLQSVADLAVPRIADRCTVHLLNGHMTRIESTPGAGSEPVDEELSNRYPMWISVGPEQVARTGASELYPEVTDSLLERAAENADHLRLLRASGICSAMIVPMKARGRILGTISLMSVESGRHFKVEDLPLAEELARRAALAVENAQLYRKAEDASRAKSEFLATMSHELRTPLNAISGYTDLLQLGLSEQESRRGHLERIKASTWQLLSMIEEILTFSRLEAGTAAVHREVVEAQDLVREAADLLEPAIRQKGLAVRLDLPDTPLQLTTDRLKIRQILMNLLSNAVKFTEGGEVTVDVRAEPGEALFRVTDTGLGIRPEQLERIFEPFWQADAGRTRRTGGTGIGLAVAWRLAELLGGSLEVQSAYGSGSTFTLRLPLA